MLKENSVPIYDSDLHRKSAWYELVQTFLYKDLIMLLVRRDVTSRYKRSFLGIAWTMLNPLGMMVILTMVFSNVFKGTEGYAAYILSGLVAWNFFSQSTVSGINSVVWGGNLFSRIYVPKPVFTVSAVGTGIVNLGFSLVPLVVVALIIGVPINFNFFWVLVPVLLLAIFTLGISLIVASFGIYFPDIVEMYNVLLLAWMYLTPIIYPMDILPAWLQSMLRFNPMLYFVELFRSPVIHAQVFDLRTFGICSAIAVVTLIIGWLLFTRMSDEIAYRT